MRAVGREGCAGADVHGVGAGAGLRQPVCPDPLAGGQLGQVALLLLLGAVPDQRQGGDADVRAKGRGKACQHGEMIGDHVEVVLSIPMPPYSSGMSTEVNPSSAGLAQQSRQHPRLLGLDVRGGGQDLVAGKLGRGGRDLALLFVQVLRSEDLGWAAGLKQKASALGGHNRRNSRRGHGDLLQLYGNITLIRSARQLAGCENCKDGSHE